MQFKVVDTLLAAGCDPNAADSEGTTPVHEAAMAGHEITFIALLEKGGNLELKNAKGENAAALACDNNKILQLISEHQAEIAKQSSKTGNRGPRRLSELLEEMDLSRYIDQFKHENVDLEVFFELKEQDFVDMNIAYGPKKRMLDVIERYKKTGVIRSDAFDAPQGTAMSTKGSSVSFEYEKIITVLLLEKNIPALCLVHVPTTKYKLLFFHLNFRKINYN